MRNFVIKFCLSLLIVSVWLQPGYSASESSKFCVSKLKRMAITLGISAAIAGGSIGIYLHSRPDRNQANTIQEAQAVAERGNNLLQQHPEILKSLTFFQDAIERLPEIKRNNPSFEPFAGPNRWAPAGEQNFLRNEDENYIHLKPPVPLIEFRNKVLSQQIFASLAGDIQNRTENPLDLDKFGKWNFIIEKNEVIGFALVEKARTDLRSAFTYERFLEEVSKSGFEKNLFHLKNPYVADEQQVANRTALNKGSGYLGERIDLSGLQDFAISTDGILLVPDIHDLLLQSLYTDLAGSSFVNWITLELSSDYQTFIDQIISGDPTSEATKFAWVHVDAFDKQSLKRGVTDPKNAHLLRDLVELARTRKIPIIAHDVSEQYKDTVRLDPGQGGDDMLTMGVRNMSASKKIPVQGRGLVFAGLAHIKYPGNVNIQDLVHERFPNRPIYVLDLLPPKK